jgi:hypothetical protein
MIEVFIEKFLGSLQDTDGYFHNKVVEFIVESIHQGLDGYSLEEQDAIKKYLQDMMVYLIHADDV